MIINVLVFKEKKIPRAVLIDAIEVASIKHWHTKRIYERRNVRVELNMDQGTFKLLLVKMLLKKYLTTEMRCI